MTVKVRRKDRLSRKLKRLAPASAAALAKAAEKAGQEMVDTAQRFAPVDDGTLRDAIQFELTPERTGARVFVGAEAFYATFQEFGTVEHPPQPFFFPAYRLLRKRARSRFTRAINAAVKKVAQS